MAATLNIEYPNRSVKMHEMPTGAFAYISDKEAGMYNGHVVFRPAGTDVVSLNCGVRFTLGGQSHSLWNVRVLDEPGTKITITLK